MKEKHVILYFVVSQPQSMQQVTISGDGIIHDDKLTYEHDDEQTAIEYLKQNIEKFRVMSQLKLMFKIQKIYT